MDRKLVYRGYTGNHPGMLALLTPMKTPPTQSIPKCLIHDAILNPPISWYGLHAFLEPAEQQFIKHTYPAPGCSEIHMIWTDSPCWITCWNDSNTYIQALQKPSIECIVAMHPWLENDCLMADIILPGSHEVRSARHRQRHRQRRLHLHLSGGPLHRPRGRVALQLRYRHHDRREAGAQRGVYSQ